MRSRGYRKRASSQQRCPMCWKWKPDHEDTCGLAVFERGVIKTKRQSRAGTSRMDGIEQIVKARTTTPEYPKTGWVKVTATGPVSLDPPTPENTVHDIRANVHIDRREAFERRFDLYARHFEVMILAFRN